MTIEIFFLSSNKILNGRVGSFDEAMIRLIPAVLEITKPCEPVRPYSTPKISADFDAHVKICLTGEELLKNVIPNDKYSIFKFENRTFKIAWRFDINDIIKDLNYVVRIPVTANCKADDICYIKLDREDA